MLRFQIGRFLLQLGNFLLVDRIVGFLPGLFLLRLGQLILQSGHLAAQIVSLGIKLFSVVLGLAVFVGLLVAFVQTVVISAAGGRQLQIGFLHLFLNRIQIVADDQIACTDIIADRDRKLCDVGADRRKIRLLR